MSAGKRATARPKRASEEIAHTVCARVWAADAHELQKLKDDIAHAVKLLRMAEDDLGKVASYMDVCIDALRAKGGDDTRHDIAMVLSDANVKLVEHVVDDLRNALKALIGQDGAK